MFLTCAQAFRALHNHAISVVYLWLVISKARESNEVFSCFPCRSRDYCLVDKGIIVFAGKTMRDISCLEMVTLHGLNCMNLSLLSTLRVSLFAQSKATSCKVDITYIINHCFVHSQPLFKSIMQLASQ